MSLVDVRARIDELDDRIVALLALRQEQVRRAGTYKRDADAVRAPDRRVHVMARLAERAVAEGVDPGVVAAVYTAMIHGFVALELREHKAGGQEPGGQEPDGQGAGQHEGRARADRRGLP